MHLITRKIDNPIKKWVKELNRHFSKEDIQTATNTCKEAQHHSLSEKCKSKPQWGIISCWSEWLLPKSLQNKCWRGCGGKGILLHCWWECKLVQSLWRAMWRFLKNLETELNKTSNPTAGHKHWGNQNWKRHVYPSAHCSIVYNSQGMEVTWVSIGRWMDKKAVVHIQYSAIKKNTFESVLMRWMKLEPIMQNEVSQKEKYQYSILTHTYINRI